MRAIVWQGPNEMTVEERPDPEDPGPGELILKPEAVGICGSEVEGYLGHMGNRTPPLVMGHEFAGVVVAAGPGGEEFDGARVTVNPLSGCGHCRLCRAGHTNLCADRVLIGIQAQHSELKVLCQQIAAMPEIGCVIMMLGRFDILAIGLFSRLEDIVEVANNRILSLPGVRHVETSIAVKTLKYDYRVAKITKPRKAPAAS